MDEKKLLNILKLKEAFEKELEKRGKLKRKPTVKKKESPPPKLKIEIGPPALVDASKVETLLDVNKQDYGALDEAVVKALKSTIGKVGNVKKRLIVDGIISLLSGDYSKALSTFEKFEGDSFRYMRGLTLLYMGSEDVLEYAIKFVRERSTSYLSHLLLSEVLMHYGKYKESAKFFSNAATISKDPYLLLTYNIYSGNEPASRKLFPYCVNRGGYKLLLAIYSIYLESDPEKADKMGRTLKGKKNPCSAYNSLFWSSLTPSKEFEEFQYCPRLKIMEISRKYYNGEHIDEEDLPINDPLVYLFMAVKGLNEGDNERADEYFEKFKENVEFEEVVIFRTPKAVKKVGITQFFSNLSGTQVQKVKELSASHIKEALKSVIEDKKYKEEEVDFKVKFKDPEIIRLFFGHRHCRRLYQEA